MTGDWTPEQVSEFKTRLTEALKHGRIEIIPPLPRKVRFRLWCTAKIDATGIWLCKRRCTVPVAEALWRLTRKW